MGSRSYLHFNKKKIGREEKKKISRLFGWAFNSSQLQPCCRVLVMAILEYKLFTCSNTQTVGGIQVFSPPSLSFFSPHLCVCVCLSDCMYGCVRPGSPFWMKNKNLCRLPHQCKHTELAVILISTFTHTRFFFLNTFFFQMGELTKGTLSQTRQTLLLVNAQNRSFVSCIMPGMLKPFW